MNYPKILGIVAVLVLALSACSTAATPTQAPINTLPPVATEPLSSPTSALTEAPTMAATEAPTLAATEPATGTGTPGVPVTGANCANVTVQLSSNANLGGTSATAAVGTNTPGTSATTTAGTATTNGTTVPGTATASDHLVDCNGMTLYVFMTDTPNSGSSACGTNNNCITTWPPLTVTSGSTPKAADGVDASLLSTLTRDDGTIQVTYNGWPLYLFSGDKAPGDQNGQGMNNLWYMISPTGEPIKNK